MTQTDRTVSDNPGRSLVARLAWVVLILATLYICYFHNLGAIGLVGPDEPRYAWIARDMAETGDWVTPRLYGRPWFEKPVLYYWGAALCFKIFGVSEAAARLPSAISALLATLGMAWLAWRVYGAETARWLLLLLPTTVGMIGFSHAAAPDMPFAAMLTLAMVFAAKLVGVVRDRDREVNEIQEVKEAKESARSPHAVTRMAGFSSFTSLTSSTSFDSLCLGALLGLAVLAKGPAAVILAGGGVLLWAIFTKHWRDAFRCLHPAGITSFCLTALPWYILCARRNPDFFRIFIIEHNFKRYLTPEFQHIQPIWFYVPVLLIAFMPWTLLLLWALGHGSLTSWRTKRLSLFVLFLLSSVIFCLVFFSVSKSKLPGYVLPAVALVAFLLSRCYVCLSGDERSPLRWLLIAVALATLGTACLMFLIGFKLRSRGSSGVALIVVAFVLLLFAVANIALIIRSSKPTVFLRPLLCVLPLLLILLMFRTLARPWLHWDPSGKTLAGEIVAEAIPPDRIYVKNMPRGQHFSLNFYLHREVADWSVESPTEGYLLLRGRYCQSVVKSPWACVIAPTEPGKSGWFINRVERSAQ